MALVELKSACAVLDGLTVFESLDFHLNAGESAAILGANGAGKTTILRLLAGEIWPVPAESRTFDFGSGPTWSPLSAREQIALVSPLTQEKTVRLAQDGADNERGARLTVRQCIATGLFDSFLLHQTPTALQQEQVETMLQRFNLEELALRELETLSQGQLRRVLLARALVKKPRLVLLDEAASGLDARARTDLFQALHELSDHSTSFVFASHRSEELPTWSQCWNLKNGHLQREDTSPAQPTSPPTFAPWKTPPAPSEAQSPSVFALHNVSVFLGGTSILHELNWQWPRGVHLRVRGENGSGKSTFLRLLSGDLSPALGGNIERLNQKNLRPIWEWRRRIALVSPQLQARFHDSLSVREAVSSGFEGGFVAPRELTSTQTEAVERVLKEWQLLPLAARRFDRLSFGQTRRVLLARALVAAPEVVLLDEALDGLDAQTRAWCNDKWAHLAQNGVHFAFASHHDEDFPTWTSGEITFEEGYLKAT